MTTLQPAKSEQTLKRPILDYQPANAKTTRSLLLKLLGVVCCLGIAAGLAWAGIDLRKSIYVNGVHYWGDPYNAFRYGDLAVRYPPLLDFPETITKGVPEYRQGKFDYPPLRLTVSYLWVKYWMRPHFPQVDEWPIRGNFAQIEPLLNLNTSVELVSAIFIFMLIRMWTIRADDAKRPSGVPPRPFRGVISGMIGAAIFWFNPAILINAHDWPQWDVWFFPFVLGAMLLGSVDAWLGVGLVLAVGACFKGQVLLSMPIFILWPLFRGKFDALLQLAGGFAFGFAAVALPWMRPTQPAILWICLMGAAALLLLPLALRVHLHWGWFAGLGAVAVLLVFPWQSDASFVKRILPVSLIGLVGVARFAPRRLIPALVALSLGLAGFLIIPLFHGKTYWYDVSFDYGSRKFMTMAVPGTQNLPSILMTKFGWGAVGTEGDPLMKHWVPLLGDVVIRKFLQCLQLACCVLCGIGAAMHSKKPDTRFLLAMATPMLCAFVLLPQLNDRYIVWAAGLSALLVAVNPGLTILGLLISCIGYIGMAELMWYKYDRGHPWQAEFTSLNVDLGWILILCAAVYLYMIFVPRNRKPSATSP